MLGSWSLRFFLSFGTWSLVLLHSRHDDISLHAAGDGLGTDGAGLDHRAVLNRAADHKRFKRVGDFDVCAAKHVAGDIQLVEVARSPDVGAAQIGADVDRADRNLPENAAEQRAAGS